MPKPSRLPDSLDALFTNRNDETHDGLERVESAETENAPAASKSRRSENNPVTPKIPKTTEMRQSQALLEKFTIPVSSETAKRIYSEVFNDPNRRWLWVVVAEILEEGLARRPRQKDAPEEWIAQHKVKGKAKKS